MSQFDFLEKEHPELYEMCVEVETGVKPYDKAHKARKVIERITQKFVSKSKMSLTNRIDKLKKEGILEDGMYQRFVAVRALGNDASHENTAKNVTDTYIPMLMDHLYKITQWYANYCCLLKSQKKVRSKKEIKKEKELLRKKTIAQKKSKKLHDVNYELWELGNQVEKCQDNPLKETSARIREYLNKAAKAQAKNEHEKMFEWYWQAALEKSAVGQFETGYCYHYGIGTERDYSNAVRYYKKALEQGYGSAKPFLNEVEKCLFIEKKNKRIAECLSKARYASNAFRNKEAFDWYRKAVQEGSAEGMYELGYCYYYGFGVKENHAEAITYYQLAEGVGHEKAHETLTAIENQSKDVLRQNEIQYWKEKAQAAVERNAAGDAFTYYKKALDLGDTEAHYIIACWCEEGIGCGYNNKKAAELYRRAAEFGIVDAQYRLGECYEYGRGVSRDYTHAREWYLQASKQGHPNTREALKRIELKQYEQETDAQKQYEIGIWYRNNGDDKNAVRFYQKAARQGQKNAMYMLGICHEFGHGIMPNAEKAIDCYRQAVHLRYQPAVQALERVIRQREERKQAEKRAREIKERESEQTETRPDRQYAIATRYHNLGNYTEALLFYQKAACQDYAKAIHTIGQYYEFGYCDTKDIEEAVKWYQKARKLGYVLAKLDLMRIEEQKKMQEDK